VTHLAWPELPYHAWKDTYETLHMWTQIVGKIRLARMPWLNHTFVDGSADGAADAGVDLP